MLKDPQKADLDKDGKLSSYEKRRGKAIEANMMKAKTGKDIKIIEAVAKEPIIGSNKSKSAKTLGKTLGKEIKKKSMGGEMMKARVGRSIERKKSNLVKKTPVKDFIKNTLEGKYVDMNKGTAESSDMILNKRKITKRNMGGEMRGYGAARTSGMGLQDEQLVPGKSLDYYKDIM